MNVIALNSGRDSRITSSRRRSSLSRAASRLLAALSAPGSAAIPDPTREGTLILRASGAGVSLGRGHHPESAAEELVRAGLAERLGAGLAERAPATTGRPAVTISEPGRAHLRRHAAEPEAAFMAQHAVIVTAEVEGENGREKVAMNAAESPLGWLRRRRDRDGEPFLDPAAFEAGERLRRDLTLGGMLPAVTARWDGAIGGAGGAARDPAGATDAMIAARQRARRALDAVGRDLADLLIDLCGFLKGLETVERERGWPARSGKVVVRLALRRLAEHYGLEVEARGPARSAGIRRWSDAGASAPGVEAEG